MSWREEHYSSLNDILAGPKRRAAARVAAARAASRESATLPYGNLTPQNRGFVPNMHMDPTPYLAPPIAPVRPTINMGGGGGQAARIAAKRRNWAAATNSGLGGGFGEGRAWQKGMNTPGTVGILPTSTYARSPIPTRSVKAGSRVIPPAPANTATEAAATGTSVRETIQNKFSEGKIGTRLNAGLTGIGFFGGGDLARASSYATGMGQSVLKFGESNGARLGVAGAFGAIGASQFGSMIDRAKNHQYGAAALHGAVATSAAAMAYGYAMNKEALSNHLAIAAKMFMRKI